jgi:hypothetical protein
MPNMNPKFNEWSKLKFVDPGKILPQLRIIQLTVAASTLDDRVKNLRTHQLKRHREAWEAALFCYGMSKMLGNSVYVAPYEASDYDAVALRMEKDTQYYTPIQIKELVPEDLNPHTDINKEIAKLNRYPVSNDTAVVIHINRAGRLDLLSIKTPQLNIGSLWVLGASIPDQSRWFIAGNLLGTPGILEFDYPVV